jgi:hypothetical protein
MVDRIRAAFISVTVVALLVLGMVMYSGQMYSGQAPVTYNMLDATATPTPLNTNGDPGGHGG